MEEENVIGYHGTTHVIALKIKEEENFIPSEDKKLKLYLGKGIYFYIDYKDAISWNIKSYRKKYDKCADLEELNKEYDIISADIIVPKENILDLDKVENIKIFNELVESIKGKLKTKPEYQYARNKDGAIINYLMRLKLLTGVDRDRYHC